MPSGASASSLAGPEPRLKSIAETQPSGLHLLLRRAFSFPVLLSTLLATLTVLTVKARFNDPDLWWHLKIGEIVWQTHSIPRLDPFAFTTHGHAWIAHEWLAQSIIYGAWKLGGYTGLMLWLCAVPSLLFIMLYVLCSIYSGNAKVSLIGALTGWFLATVSLAIRPLLIGHLCLVLELILIHLARTRDRRWLIALPPLFAIWVNCHGSFVVGLLVLGVYWCCSYFDLSLGSLVCRRWPSRDRRWLGVTTVCCAGALLVNPLGIRLVTYPFVFFFNQSHGMSYVNEWKPLDLTDGRAMGLLAIAGLIYAMALIRKGEFRLEELILLALGFGMAMRHQRMVFVLGILAAPVVSRLLSGAWERYDPRRDHRIANAVLMLASFAIMYSVFPTRAQLEKQVVSTSPVHAVEFIRHAGLRGPMLNEYEFGFYLIWALPEQKVFIDGRSDVYDWNGVFEEMARWAMIQENPTLLLNRYGINYCLLRKGTPMTQVLPFLPGWKQVYGDELAVIFVRGDQAASLTGPAKSF
jgi:hypothetical protein